MRNLVIALTWPAKGEVLTWARLAEAKGPSPCLQAADCLLFAGGWGWGLFPSRVVLLLTARHPAYCVSRCPSSQSRIQVVLGPGGGWGRTCTRRTCCRCSSPEYKAMLGQPRQEAALLSGRELVGGHLLISALLPSGAGDTGCSRFCVSESCDSQLQGP